MKDYMTGSQLRQYLHISTRKMKYLMDYNYIPHINTGKPTHKYLVKCADARAFQKRLCQDADLQAQLAGHFSSHSKGAPKPAIPINRDALQEFLLMRWRAMPEALLIEQAAQMLGSNRNSILRLSHIGQLEIMIVMGKRYCTKENLIAYLTRPEVTCKPVIGNYREVLCEFQKKQCSK